MAEGIHTLKAQSPLNGLSKSWAGLSIREVVEGELCSLSVSNDQREKILTAFEHKFGGALPEAGKLVALQHGLAFWTAPNQWFLATTNADPKTELRLRKSLGDGAVVTLQTDAWAQIEISGERAGDIMERMIALDLCDDAFPEGSAARTQVHHINVFVLRLPGARNSFRFMSARSFSQSFADALQQTATSLIGPALS